MSAILPHWAKLFTVNDRETVVLSAIESVPEKSNRAMAVIGIPNPSHIAKLIAAAAELSPLTRRGECDFRRGLAVENAGGTDVPVPSQRHWRPKASLR
jgi:hypothetical protein